MGSDGTGPGPLFKSSKLGHGGLILIAVFIVVALFRPPPRAYDPLRFGKQEEVLNAPSRAHVLGTDDNGPRRRGRP